MFVMLFFHTIGTLHYHVHVMLTLPKGYGILKSDHVYCTRCYLNSHVNYVGVQSLMYVCM